MCIVCIEIAKGSLNRSEAKRALAEIAIDPKQEEHVQEVFELLEKEEKANSKVKGLAPQDLAGSPAK